MAGTGPYITVSEDKVDEAAAGYAGGRNILVEKFDETFGLVNTTRSEFNTNMEALLALLDSLIVPQAVIDQIGDVVIDDIPGIDFTAISAPSPPTLPGFESIVFPLAPIFKNVPDVDFSQSDPTAPAPVNPVLNYSITPYNSALWYELFTKVHDGLDGTDDGIDTQIEGQIWSRARDRQRLPREKLLASANAEITTRGVKYPALMLRSQQQKVFAEAAQEDTNLNADIAIKQSDLAQAWKQFIVDKAVTLEQALRDFHIRYESLNLDQAKAAAQLILQNYAEAVKGYVAEWDGFIAKRKSEVDKINVFIAQNKLLGDVYDISTKGAIAQTELISKQRESLVDSYKVEGDVYEAKVRALTSWYAALSENQRLKLEKNRVELEQIVQQVRAYLDTLISFNSLKERILSELGNVSAQVLASALNAVNTSIGHSTNYGEQRAESWSHNGSLNDNHNYTDQ